MRIFFLFSLIYAIAAITATATIRNAGPELVDNVVVATLDFGYALASTAKWAVPVMIVVPLVIGWRNLLSRASSIFYAAFGCILLQVGFSFFKTLIPLMVPFYADEALARLDRALHGGTDPWVLAHTAAQWLPMDWILPIYVVIWAIPALSLPLAIALTDGDRDRSARIMVLYVGCWVVLGNLLATACASVGPVFYDALLHTGRFSSLTDALAGSEVANSIISVIQHHLWQAYAENGVSIGTGISAFPSVHLGIATLTVIYLYERSRWLAIPGLAFLGAILFLSVYTGFHYAIDGYLSIILMTAAWVMLRRVQLTGLARPRVRRGRPAAAGQS